MRFKNKSLLFITLVCAGYVALGCAETKISNGNDGSPTDGDGGTDTLDVCEDQVDGPPELVSGTSVAYAYDTTSDELTVQFNEDVTGMALANLTWTATTGTGTLDSIVQVDAKTYRLVFSGTQKGDGYELGFSDQVIDVCANPIDASSKVTVSIHSGIYFEENFDSMTVGSVTAQNGWTATPSSSSEFAWLTKTSATPTEQTGPSSDHTSGTGRYAYTEATNYGAIGNIAEMVSRDIDLTLAVSPKFSFWYHMYGANIGTLEVTVKSLSGYTTTVFSEYGQQQTSKNDPWMWVGVDLDSWVGETIYLVFKGISGAGVNGDISVDDIRVREPSGPEADFIADRTLAGTSQSTYFTDLSVEFPTSWLWTITGPGTPTYESGTSDTSQNPIVSFDTAGLYTVELQASNAAGSDTKTKVDYIEIQDFCEVGTGTTVSTHLPIEPYYKYSFAETIYLASELCGAKTIDYIVWEYNGGSSVASSTEPIDIFMNHTTDTVFASTTDWTLSSGMFMVYSGTITMTQVPGWITITLDTPFPYNGTDNLIIAVDRDMGSYPTGDASEFYATSVTGNRSLYQFSDNDNQDPTTCSYLGTLSTNIANVRFGTFPI